MSSFEGLVGALSHLRLGDTYASPRLLWSTLELEFRELRHRLVVLLEFKEFIFWHFTSLELLDGLRDLFGSELCSFVGFQVEWADFGFVGSIQDWLKLLNFKNFLVEGSSLEGHALAGILLFGFVGF